MRSQVPQQDFGPGSQTLSTSKIMLSPAAKAILDMADLDYAYPTPKTERCSASPNPDYQSSRALPTPALSKSSDIQKHNEAAYSLNRAAPASSTHSNVYLNSSRHPAPVITIPSIPPEQADGYMVMPESPKRRKLNHESYEDLTALRLRPERDVADSAVRNFVGFLLEIFEAQDHLAPDTSTVDVQASNLFEQPDLDDDEGDLRLALPVLLQLQSSLKQLVEHKRLADIDGDQLRRLQQLCEKPIESAQTMNLKPGEEFEERDHVGWPQRIRKAENGVASCCVVSWIVLGTRNEEQSQSEEIVACLPKVLVHVFDDCLIPLVEARAEGKDSALFQHASTVKPDLRRLLNAAGKLLDLFCDICVHGCSPAGSINTVEFLAAKILFVENAPSEKASLFGIQPFEQVRKAAMNVLSQLYAQFPSERNAILDEILTSLDKLPTTSRGSRQYKLADGRNIQLVSALLMQLVQTTALESPQQSTKERGSILIDSNENASDSDDGGEETMNNFPGKEDDKDSLGELTRKIGSLANEGARSAQEVINYLVQKASMSTKSGDQPYRNLFDLLVEDLINVLTISDWPASELLLRIIVVRMLDMARNEKSASSKNMALELLGLIGSAISSLRASLPNLVSAYSRENEQQTSPILLEFADNQMIGSTRNEDLISINGPFATAYHHLARQPDNSLHAKSARAFHLVQWGNVVRSVFRTITEQDENTHLDSESSHLVQYILEEISNCSSSVTPTAIEIKSNSEGRLAFTLAILNFGVCRRFQEIVRTLVDSFTGDQAQVRSRSLKSVVSILENDPSILDSDPIIVDDIFKCASDDSAMVRDSALSLIARIVIPRPALEERGVRRLLECAADEKIGVRKRSIGYLRDIYARDSRLGLKAAIAETLLKRSVDHEEAVAELAKRTLSEVWIGPHSNAASAGDDNAKAQIEIRELATLLVHTISQNASDLSPLLENFWSSNMKREPKTSHPFRDLACKLVTALFESMITEDASSSFRDKQALLLTITAFAKSNAVVVAPEQLKSLQPYLGNLVKDEDLLYFKPVVTIFRCVLPHLSSAHQPLLQAVQADLMKSISKLGRRTELDEVMSCLWGINSVLHNTERLVRLLASVINGVLAKAPALPAPPTDIKPDQIKTLVTYLRITGSAGKFWDLEGHIDSFKSLIRSWKGISVTDFLADLMLPFTSLWQHNALQAVALESLGAICQSWPGQLKKEPISQAFLSVLRKEHPLGQGSETASDVQLVVLRAFSELFSAREGAKAEVDTATEQLERVDLAKIGGSSKSRDHDGAVAFIAQIFLGDMLRIATSRQDDKALASVSLTASICRQGMVHPKQCAGPLVALSTSTNPEIASIALTSHRLMHQQHESMYEREYMRAVQETFYYQKDVVGDASGATRSPYRAKLASCFEVIGSSSPKYVKTFLSNFVRRTSFELEKVDVARRMPDHLLLTRFIIQNLAFFEYRTADELLHVLLQLEILASKSGGELLQAIEASMQPHLHPTVNEGHGYIGAEPQLGPVNGEVVNGTTWLDDATLKRFATAATGVTMLWETRSYLKRQYGIGRSVRQAMEQLKQTRESGKPPLKVHGISGDKFWARSSELMASLDSRDAMTIRCQQFASLMSLDDDIKVSADDDGLPESYSGGNDFHDDYAKPPGSGRNRKRKTPASASSTPRKKRGSVGRNMRGGSTSSKDDPDADYEG